MKNKNNQVIFIYKTLTHFVKKDFDLISEISLAKNYQCVTEKSLIGFIWPLFKEFIFLLKNIRRTQVLFIWFADYHSFLPVLFAKIFNRKVYVVLGGYDVTYLPEYKYGSFSNPLRSFCAGFSIKNATLNLAVSDNLISDAKKRVKNGSFKLLPTGYDSNIMVLKSNELKKPIVLTVSITDNKQRFMIKGLDRFIELAENCPDLDFVVIGVKESAKFLFNNIPPNLKILPPVEHNELYQWFSKSKFYAQFSRSEGLPNSICEAMLFECIPLGVDIGGIKYAIGNSGIINHKWDAIYFKNKLLENLNNETLPKLARQRVVQEFNVERRQEEITKLIT